jgi:DNA-binding NarL/FixJ family response regulator
MTRIAIVDDHQIVIDGLKLLLDKHPGFSIVAEATSGSQMLDLLGTVAVDVLIADIMMPGMDGYELTRQVRKQYPDIRLIALSMNCDGAYIDKMIGAAQLNGYMLKASGKEELISAVEAVAAGEDYFAEEILEELKSFRKTRKQNAAANLTIRELEVIRCIIDGMNNRQIAQALFISEYTVESHRKNIFRKTDTHTALSLAAYVRDNRVL